MGEGSSSFIPETIVTSINSAISDAQEAITGVITDNFNTLMIILGTTIGVSVAIWVIRLVKRFMSGR